MVLQVKFKILKFLSHLVVATSKFHGIWRIRAEIWTFTVHAFSGPSHHSAAARYWASREHGPLSKVGASPLVTTNRVGCWSDASCVTGVTVDTESGPGLASDAAADGASRVRGPHRPRHAVLGVAGHRLDIGSVAVAHAGRSVSALAEPGHAAAVAGGWALWPLRPLDPEGAHFHGAGAGFEGVAYAEVVAWFAEHASSHVGLDTFAASSRAFGPCSPSVPHWASLLEKCWVIFMLN